MKSIKIKILIGAIGVVVLYQGAKWGYGEAAEAYFEYRCEQDAGEFIYRTVENVEGVFQMRPRDPRDYFSRLREGDLPEDPFGHTDPEAKRPSTLFVTPPSRNYKYLETTVPPRFNIYSKYDYVEIIKSSDPNAEYWIYYGRDYKQNKPIIAEQVSELKSQYGFTWREVRNEWDRLFGVLGGELIVKELATDETLGVRRGYFFWPPFSKKGAICPKDKHGAITYTFISKVLIPLAANQTDSVLQGESK